jgi:putative ABC transport system permease protein
MTFRDLLGDTLSTLRAHKLRTGLTMFGLGWGVVSITLMTAAGDGFRIGQAEVAKKFGDNIAIVFAGRTSLHAGGQRAGRSIRWTATDHLELAPQTPDCGVVMPELTRDLSVRSSYNNASLTVSGSIPVYQQLRYLPAAEGRFYSAEDDRDLRRVAFLGSEARKQLFAGRKALGEAITINGVPFQVIGVSEHKEQDSDYDGRDVNKVFVPFNTMLRDFPNRPPMKPNEIDQLIVKAKSLDVHDSCIAELRRGLARVHGYDPEDKEAAFIWDTVEEGKAFAMMANGMKYFLGAMGVVTLILGGIGTMNVMLVAVRERTREIGLRKAVGATSGEILSMFFLETLFIVAISGGVGMGVAHAICWGVNKLPMPQFFAGLIPTWEVGAVCILLLGLIAILAAIYPASRAASIDPIEALRFEPGG